MTVGTRRFDRCEDFPQCANFPAWERIAQLTNRRLPSKNPVPIFHGFLPVVGVHEFADHFAIDVERIKIFNCQTVHFCVGRVALDDLARPAVRHRIAKPRKFSRMRNPRNRPAELRVFSIHFVDDFTAGP